METKITMMRSRPKEKPYKKAETIKNNRIDKSQGEFTTLCQVLLFCTVALTVPASVTTSFGTVILVFTLTSVFFVFVLFFTANSIFLLYHDWTIRTNFYSENSESSLSNFLYLRPGCLGISTSNLTK